METKKLLMSDDELVIAFKTSKNKREQVKILADLNLCAPFIVAERLESLGAFRGTSLVARAFSKRYKAEILEGWKMA